MNQKDFDLLRTATAKKEALFISVKPKQVDDALKRCDRKNAEAIENNIKIAVSNNLFQHYVTEYYNKSIEDSKSYAGILAKWKPGELVGQVLMALPLSLAGCDAHPLTINEELGKKQTPPSGIVPTLIPPATDPTHVVPVPVVQKPTEAVPTQIETRGLEAMRGIISVGESLELPGYRVQLDKIEKAGCTFR